KAAFTDFMNDVARINARRAINILVTSHSLTLEKYHFAQLYELCEKCKEDNAQFIVQSIDSVKGLDA
ncbi:hypothetical protein CGK32_24610, partial [Vibrio parahaemolyticus]